MYVQTYEHLYQASPKIEKQKSQGLVGGNQIGKLHNSGVTAPPSPWEQGAWWGIR